jgi:predicted nucleic acid-binding protein
VVILVDSSAWVEFLRRTESAVHHRVHRLMAETDEIVTTEAIHMELLAGARDDAHVTRLRRLLARFPLLPAEGLADFEQAAAVYRACRSGGETVRNRIDCLIAAVALRADATVLHLDRDFEVIARYTPLQLAS